MTTNLTGIIHKRKDLALKDEMMAQIQRQISADSDAGPSSRLTHLMPYVHDSSMITVMCDPMQYSASTIARAIEDCDAHLLNLNVTADSEPGGRMAVELRIDHRNPARAIHSLERYGYEVAGADYQADDAETEQMRDRINELIHYLEI